MVHAIIRVLLIGDWQQPLFLNAQNRKLKQKKFLTH